MYRNLLWMVNEFLYFKKKYYFHQIIGLKSRNKGVLYTYIWSKLVTVLGIRNQVLNKNNFKLSPFSLFFGKEGQFVVKKWKEKFTNMTEKMHHQDITLYSFNISSQLAASSNFECRLYSWSVLLVFFFYWNLFYSEYFPFRRKHVNCS